MTGHGRTQVRGDIPFSVEVSSINRKQLDVQCGLPRVWATFEAQITRAIQKKLSRGRISVQIAADNEVSREGTINEAAAARYLKEFRALGKRLKIEDDLRLSDLLALPDVVRVNRESTVAPGTWKVIERGLNRALKDLLAMREAEGALLVKDLSRFLGDLAQLAQRIERRAPIACKQHGTLLRERLKKAGLSFALDDERLLKEIAMFGERSDISEELIRIESHLEQAVGMLKKGGVIGRSLDFLSVELNREINTVGSKSHDAKIATWVIEFKSQLEKFREQVQNIE